jgi:hypothetical protein
MLGSSSTRRRRIGDPAQAAAGVVELWRAAWQVRLSGKPKHVRPRAERIALAERFRLPAVYPYRYYVTEGGLLYYGVDNVDLFRQAAAYVDRILRGESPAELPI